MSPRLFAPIAALVLLAPATAQAQQVSLAPTVGLYVPTTELVKAASGEEFKQEIALTVGGRLGVAFGERLGFEATATYIPSDLRFSFDGTEVSESADLYAGSARATFHVIPVTSPFSFSLSGGVSATRRGGEAYEGVDDRTDVGGVVGATVRLRLGSVVNLMVSADDFVYSARYEDGAQVEKRTQHDVHLSFGVGLPLLGF